MSKWVVALSAVSMGGGLSACGDDASPPSSASSTGSSSGPVTTLTPTEGGTQPVDTSATTQVAETGIDGTATTSSESSSGTVGPGSNSSGEMGSSSSGGDAAPSVQSTTPADFESGVEPTTDIAIEFSEPMDAATVTTTTAGTLCVGAIQVSADAFTTCVPMMGEPTTRDDQVFVVQPQLALSAATTYQVRVLPTATDAGGTPLAAEFTTGNGFAIRYFDTIVIDGVNDFSVAETFPTSTVGHSGYVAWDDDYIYLGLDSPDVAAASGEVWWVVYVGGPQGSGEGVTYNTQSPALPFDARWHLRWRTDGTFASALTWSGVAWEDAAFTIGADDVASTGEFVEMRVSRLDVGLPAYLDLHMGLLREEALNEASWGAVPEGSYVDGYDPDYAQFFQFDLASSLLPTDVMPSP
ncbi:MAG: Ig-like domain-containing protein [Deltaproteobacteria bacterium]|nr:Ig-like domain-containing protein [Deltaproteobacteria bacterium]